MRDAQYLRAQAEFCLEVARQVSDHTAVENLQAEAARYHAEAVEVEAEDHPGSVGDPKAAAPYYGGGPTHQVIPLAPDVGFANSRP